MAECLVNTRHVWGSTPYQIYEPGHIVPEGGNSLVYAKPLNIIIGKPPTYYDNCSWAIMSWSGWDGGDMTAALAAMTDSWACTGSGINNVTHRWDWETFYTLLWEVLQNKTRPEDKQITIINKAIDQLNAAPCEGPYCYKADTRILGGGFILDGFLSRNGWASTYKWYSKTDHQLHGDGAWPGNYNGTDYMILYNLYHIINYESCPYYVNYIDRKIAGYFPFSNGIITSSNPMKYTAFNTLTSTQFIGTQSLPVNTSVPGNVTYVATTSIHLKPGFHAMPGCYFHAYINDIDCSGEESSSRSMSDTNYFNTIYSPLEDSLISLPKTPYPLTLEDTTGDNHLLTLPCGIDTIRFMGMNGDTSEFDYYYYWDFGNGVTSSRKDPKVFYQPGTYNFMLVLTDTNGVSDTANLVIDVPDCNSTVRGSLAENPACGSVPVLYDSIWLVDVNDSIVAGVTPVVTDSIGRFWFLQNELQALDANALFAFRSGNGYLLQDTAYQTIADWLVESPLQFQLSDVLKREWKKTYSSNADSADVYAKALDLNDNLYVLGRQVNDSTGNDCLLLKYSPNGTLRWAVTYNSPYNNADKPEAICTDSLCNIYLTGSSKGGNGKNDYLTIKYDSAGTQQWLQRYDASGNGSSQDMASCIKTDRSGNVYVSGLSMNTSNDVNIVTIKYNSSGQQQWIRNFFDGDYSQFYVTHKMSMILDSLGNIYLAGSCKDSLGDNEYLLLKYNAAGTLQWSAKKNLNTQQGDYAAAIALDNSGNVIATGSTGTVKYNNNGILQWQQSGSFNKLAIDGSGDICLGNNKPSILAKYSNTNGNVLWQIDSAKIYDLAIDRNDDIYAVTEHELVKYGTSGNVITSKSFSSYGIAVCVSPNLNVYVAGNITQSGGGQGLADIVTTKYSQCPSVASLKSMSNHPPDNTAPMVAQTEKPVKIVPNPNNGEMVLLSNSNFEIGSIFRIYDLTGRVLYQITITEETTNVQVSTSDLQNGVYLYSIISPQGKLIAKDKLVIMK